MLKLPMEQKNGVFITSLALECDNLINVQHEHYSYCEKNQYDIAPLY